MPGRVGVREPGTGGEESVAGSASSVLEVRDLDVQFAMRGRVVHAVRGVHFAVREAETLGLVGESGSGKSVTALAVMGLLPQRHATVRGSVVLQGEEVVGAREAALGRLRGKRVAMVFQDPLSSLNPVLTIGRQITETLKRHRGLSGVEARRRATELLELVGIPGADKRLKAYPNEFSGGMRQRVMIAIALACDPALLIADEPTTALDVTVQAQILELLAELRVSLRMSMLLITHDLGVVANIADRVAVMYAGRIVEDAPASQILSSPVHPYTSGLLACVPRIDEQRAGRLLPIEGAPPNLAQPIVGCSFRPRCPIADRVCATDDPSLVRLSPSHAVACWAATDRHELAKGAM